MRQTSDFHWSNNQRAQAEILNKIIKILSVAVGKYNNDDKNRIFPWNIFVA